MHGFFYGNWFIGLCAVALGVEAAMQQEVPLNGAWYHVLVFLSCVVFYNHAYRGATAERATDDRMRWHVRHAERRRVVRRVLVLALVLGASGALYVYRDALLAAGPLPWALLLIFPLVALAYNGWGGVALRNIGWSKPFVLGFVWAGITTVYPVLVHAIITRAPMPDMALTARLFFKNMMFCAMLAVLFDIKDHADDHRNALRTFVVQRGLRTTLFRIVLPLTLLGLLSFLGYGAAHDFSAMKLLLNAIPFVALVAVIYALRKRRSILFYLAVVDGLFLLKAVCGSLAMRWF